MKNFRLKFIFPVILILFYSCNTNDKPLDVVLETPTLNNGVQINWTQSNDTDFNSYKLYRNTSSGIDYSNSELIHVSTLNSDTFFVDTDIDILTTYYYRVYVVNDSDISSGSNIENITTDNISLISNGGFENTTLGILNDWNLVANTLNEPNNFMDLDTQRYAGNSSLKIHHNANSGCWEQWFDQNIDISLLSPNSTYNLSFYHKSDTTQNANVKISLENSSLNIDFTETLSFNNNNNWHQFSADFTTPSSITGSDPLLRIHFCNAGIRTIWIDEIVLEKTL